MQIDHVEVVPIDPGAEARLLSLLRTGLNPEPATLEVEGASWSGAALELEALTVLSDGKLDATVELNAAPIEVGPRSWTPEHFSAHTRHGLLLIEGGAMLPSRVSFSNEGQRIEAGLQGWRWSTVGDPNGEWWVGKLQLYAGKTPTALRFIQGNALVSDGDRLERCWRFGWLDGQEAFVVPVGDEWALLISSKPGRPPNDKRVSDLLRSLGFAVGEPFALGCLSQLDEQGNTTGLASIAVMDDRMSRRRQNQPPAIPPLSRGADLAEFVDRTLRALEGDHRLPLIVAMSHYLHGLDQAVDSKFIHNWIATETLAKRVCSRPEFGVQSKAPFVRDWATWKAWVKSNRDELDALANPGEADRLYGAVVNAGMAQRDRSKVEHAFRALGLPWEPAMDDVQDVRNFAVHEGVIAGTINPAQRVWDQDRKRVGLMATMLAALIAKLVGYAGPIADREQSVFNLACEKVPSWWSVEPSPTWIDHRGTGTSEEEMDELFRKLEASFSGDTDTA